MKVLRALAGLGLLALVACAHTPQAAQTAESCQAGKVLVSWAFEGGGQHACTVEGPGRVRLAVLPDHEGVNPSPWYAFEVITAQAGGLTLTLDYGSYEHRYAPQWLLPGQDWEIMPGADLAAAVGEAAEITLDLNLPKGRTRIGAQPVTTPGSIDEWARSVLLPAGFTPVVYGQSVEGRPLTAWQAGQGTQLVVAITRQHPPEWTGGQAFDAFAQALVADKPRWADLQARYRFLLVPLANPDGLAGGRWRTNAAGVDLNRDWTAQTQPEVTSLSALITREAAQTPLVAFFDLHSTREDVVYAPDVSCGSGPAFAMMRQLKAQHAALSPGVRWTASHTRASGNAKSWSLDTFGVPGITVELADTSGPARISEMASTLVVALSGGGRSADAALIAGLNCEAGPEKSPR